MKIIDEKEIEIDGQRYLLKAMVYEKALASWVRVLAIVMPSLAAASGVGSVEEFAEKVGSGDSEVAEKAIGKALEKFSTTILTQEAQVTRVFDELMNHAFLMTEDGKEIPLMKVRSTHFSGEGLARLLPFIKEAGQFQFAGFIQPIVGAFQKVRAMAKSRAQSQKISTGEPGESQALPDSPST